MKNCEKLINYKYLFKYQYIIYYILCYNVTYVTMHKTAKNR